MKSRIIIVLTAFYLIACGEATKTDQPNNTEKETKVSMKQESTTKEKELNVDSIIASIDSFREEVENNLPEPVIISTEQLRAKTKQKWDKIHFYTLENGALRIKTYPYSDISQRTEEFYLKDGNLVLAVIEDDGSGERGKEKVMLDKMYYYHEGKILKEMKSEDKQEFTIKNADAEELQQEVKEYLEVLKSNQ